MSINSAVVLLHADATPEAVGLKGSLTESPVSGTASVSFTAKESDGPGICRVSTLIDGSTVWAQTPETSYGECVAHGTYGNALVFHHEIPCKEEVPVHVEIPTSTVADGTHLVEVAVEDAAGNRSVVFDKTITFANHPGSDTSLPTASIVATVSSTALPERGPCNGNPCNEGAKLIVKDMPTSISRAFGRSAVNLTGRLISPTGVPIKDAQVKLLQQIGGSGAMIQVANAATRADGSWSLKAPAGPSRLLQVVFYSHALDTVPGSVLDFRETVRGSVSMRAPHKARIGHAVVFGGYLAGGHIPPGGESVQMEIFYGGRWRTIEVLSTNRQGKWSYRYVFTLGVGTSYRFRAETVRDGAYPFAAATSKSVRVTVVR